MILHLKKIFYLIMYPVKQNSNLSTKSEKIATSTRVSGWPQLLLAKQILLDSSSISYSFVYLGSRPSVFIARATILPQSFYLKTHRVHAVFGMNFTSFSYLLLSVSFPSFFQNLYCTLQFILYGIVPPVDEFLFLLDIYWFLSLHLIMQILISF